MFMYRLLVHENEHRRQLSKCKTVFGGCEVDECFAVSHLIAVSKYGGLDMTTYTLSQTNLKLHTDVRGKYVFNKSGINAYIRLFAFCLSN